MSNEVLKVYKLVKLKKDGKCYPLFIDKDRAFEFGEWMHCEYHPTKGFAPRSIKGDELIGGWHCCFQPVAPHLSEELANGEKRVWLECEAKGSTQKYDRSESQGGAWLLVEYLKPLRVMPYKEVKVLQEDYIREFVHTGWASMNGTGIRGTIVPRCYKETIAKIWNVDLNKKVEVTDPFYFCEKDGELWFCWE